MALLKRSADRTLDGRKLHGRALARLREDIADIEGQHVCFEAPRLDGLARLATGSKDFDKAMGGGLLLPALTEMHAQTARDAGALSGFMIALLSLSTAQNGWAEKPILWICASGTLSETGVLYSGGLVELGFDPARLFLAAPRRLEDALWICEEAVRAKGLGAVILDMRGDHAKLGLRETQRLHTRAQASGQPVFLLRQSCAPQTSAAPQRLLISAAHSHENSVFNGTRHEAVVQGSIGPPAFRVLIDKNKTGPAGAEHILYWSRHERYFYTASNTGNGLSIATDYQGQRKATGTYSIASLPLSGDRSQSTGAAGFKMAAYK